MIELCCFILWFMFIYGNNIIINVGERIDSCALAYSLVVHWDIEESWCY